MKRGMIGVCLGLCLTAIGCKSSVEAACDKAEECGDLEMQTVDQCVADGKALLDALEKEPGCDDVRTRLNEYSDCVADLSCAERKNRSSENDPCEKEWNDLMAAGKTAGNKCDLKN